MQDALVMMYQYGEGASWACLEVKKCLAELYCDNGRYHEGRAMTSEILELSESDQNVDNIESCYDILCWIARCEGNYEEGLSAFRGWITFSEAEFGRGHNRTIDALSGLESYLREIGRAGADEALQDLDAALDELCLRDE